MSLSRVTKPDVIHSAARQIECSFKNSAETSVQWVGFPSGRIREKVHWRDDVGIWLCRHDKWDGKELRRYWLAYGVQRPGSASSLSITVEINFPRQGIDRRVAGLLAADAAGKLVICHTGRLGGGKEGVGKDAFAKWYDRSPVDVIDGDGRVTKAFTVAEVHSDRIVAQIAEYVHDCAAFKAGALSLRDDASTTSTFDGSEDEYEGTKTMPPRPGHDVSCDHGIVRNRLRDLMAQAGYEVGRDVRRDLIIGEMRAPNVEFEIKTGSDWQSLYTAVGQLVFHSVATPADRCVVVLPHPVDGAVATGLHSLGINLVTYRWTEAEIVFDRLSEMFPGVANSAPISKKIV